MGVSLLPDLRIAGYRPSDFKTGLRSFRRTGRPGRMIDLKTFPQRRDGAIVFEECLDRGLIAPDGSGYRITQAGEAIADSKLRPRTALAAAKRVFDDLLDRVERVNADPGSVLQVEEVWLFGSLMREEPTVGDIDAALVARRRPEFEDHDARRAYVARAIAARVENSSDLAARVLGRILAVGAGAVRSQAASSAGRGRDRRGRPAPDRRALPSCL